MELSSQFRIGIPQELALIARCFILLDNIIGRLDPQTSLIELAKPFEIRLLLTKLEPQNIGKVLLEYLLDLSGLLAKLPSKAAELLQMAADGELKVILEHRNFEQLIVRLTVLGNRLSFSLIIAATIIGSSLIASKAPESFFSRFPIAEVGFITAVLMGIWLLISIIRSGRI